MEPSDLLRKVVEVLESLEIRYRITGSMATIAYRDYISDWATRLGLSAEWQLVLASEAGSRPARLCKNVMVPRNGIGHITAVAYRNVVWTHVRPLSRLARITCRKP